MPYCDKIAIPVLQGDMEIEFEEVQRSNPQHAKYNLNQSSKTLGKIRDMVIFPQGTDTTNWPMKEVAKILQANRIDSERNRPQINEEIPT